MPLSPHDMRAAIVRKLPERTGKTVEEWIELVRAEGLEGRGPVTKWLKDAHGLTTSYAGAVASLLREREVSPSESIERQYSHKQDLLPILGAIRPAIPVGAEEGVRETYVTWSNGRQFALLQPSTKARADLGLVLLGEAATARLCAAGSFGSGRITHRVALRSPGDVDDELRGWLLAAFEHASG